MPNWCNNVVQVSHPDVSKMQALVESINAGEFCNFAIPLPESLKIVAGRVGADDEIEQIDLVEAEKRNLENHGYKNWFDFCVAKWGTKWDITDAYVGDATDTELYAYFDTAWSPPVEAYARLEALGFKVGAMYHEPGMAYYGSYADGVDTYGEYSTFDEIPEDIVDEFGIEDWEEYEDSEDSAEDPTED